MVPRNGERQPRHQLSAIARHLLHGELAGLGALAATAFRSAPSPSGLRALGFVGSFQQQLR